ncbi:MAG: hypothetical protein C4539_04480 [Ignavibacteriales bacterium]|nr:MAG: hypothetical protein C4539_04480 [Ignavibacteriales bacterium]
MNVKTKYFLFSLLLLSELVYLFIYTSYNLPIVNFTIVSLFNSIVFVIIWILIKDKFVSRTWLFLIIASGILFRLTMLPANPIASDDIYRYIWDGKVMSNGINPFRYAPADKELNFLHSEMLPSKVNHPEMKTIYPPYSQFIFFLSYKLFGESFLGIKIFLLLSELLTMFLLIALINILKLPSQNIVLYAICPLPIMQFMIDGHIDGTGFPILLLTILLFLNKRKISSSLMMGLSITTKFISGMILPFIWKEEKGKWKIYTVVLPILSILVLYIPFYSGNVFPLESLFQFSSNWIANSSVFSIIFFIVKDNQDARLIALLLFLLSGLILFISKKTFQDKLYLIFFLFLLFSPTVHPWYLTWLALFLPLSFRWSGLIFIVLVNLINILLIDYITQNIWYTFHWLMIIEYTPVIILFVYEIFLFKRNSQAKLNN